jgi:hypothetical protein
MYLTIPTVIDLQWHLFCAGGYWIGLYATTHSA